MMEVKKAITVGPPANMKLNPVIVVIFIIIVFVANVVYAVNKNNMDVVLVMDNRQYEENRSPLTSYAGSKVIYFASR
jgi:hypothetical protein